jgi:hypothetical protein
MVHRMLGRAHAELVWRLSAARAGAERGQGTVEYVALMLLVAGLLAAVITLANKKGGGITDAIVNKFTETINGVGKKPGK